LDKRALFFGPTRTWSSFVHIVDQQYDVERIDMSPEIKNNDNSLPTDGFREWFHSWRYLFLVIGVTGFVLLFYAEENWRGQRAWEKYKQRMGARGEQFEPAAFIPPRVADDDNFAMTPSLAPLFQFVPGTQRWLYTNAPNLFHDVMANYDAAAAEVKPSSPRRLNSWIPGRIDLNSWANAFSKSDGAKRDKERLVPATFVSKEVADRVLAGLVDLEAVLNELHDASKRPKSRFNLRYEEDNPAGVLLPHLSKLKSLCQVLEIRACAELAISRSDAALQDIRLMLYLTDATRTEPILITHLVRMAELQLALQPIAEGMGTWSEAQLRVLEQDLQGFDFCSDIKRALSAERALFGCGVIEYVRRSSNKARLIDELNGLGPGNGEAWPLGPLLVAAPGGWLYLEELNLSQAFDQHLSTTIDLDNRRVDPEKVRAAEAGIGELNSGSVVSRFLHHRFFAAMLLPAISKVAQKAAYGQTAADTAALACALERYRLAHGNLPDSLEKLNPQYIAKVPHDLITGKSLIYRPASDAHYVLYSVGWNEVDDGGVPGKTKKAESNHDDGDWVWSNQF